MKRVNLASVEAALKTTEHDSDAGVFNMTLRDMPCSARARFKVMKKEGIITGGMSDYMRRAFIEKLERDDR